MQGREHVEVRGIAVRIVAGGKPFRLLPPFTAGNMEMSWNSMSGAGDSETPSVSSSRNVRPPIGKSGGAASALSIAATSC